MTTKFNVHYHDAEGEPQDMRAAQVHRFHERVALYTGPSEGEGVTVYATPADARAIAAALIAAADDCDRRPFAQSQFRTVEIAPGVEHASLAALLRGVEADHTT